MKPRLLFLSPFTPAPGGHGSSMRAHAFLRAFAKTYDVHLIVFSRSDTACLPEALCRETARIPLALWPDPHARLKRICAVSPSLYRRLWPQPCEWQQVWNLRARFPFSIRSFNVLHVFRLYLTPLVNAWAETINASERWLDLDDVESDTRAQFAALHARCGKPRFAAHMRIEAEQYAALERRYLPRFDRVFVAAGDDRIGLPHPAPEMAPNIAPEPAESLRQAGPDNPFRFLFVGTLSYAPNEDALSWFCNAVLPLLRAGADRPFIVRVTGRGSLRRLRMPGDVVLTGYVPEIRTAYRDAHAVIVPLRVGGGTGIKVLEAFAYGRPVIATSVGLRGLAVEPGRHALVGDDPESFAGACLQLMRSETHDRQKLVDEAHRLVRSRYTPSALEAVLR